MNKSTPINTLSPTIHYSYYLVLLAIVFLVFGNTLGNDYNMDDNLVTQHHPLTSSKSLSTIVDIFKTPYYVDKMGYSYGYRPVVTLSFFIEHFFFGENIAVSHFFNLLLYATTIILFFKLLVKCLGEKGAIIALLTTIFFIIHPTHSEVVASIKNRDEILAFLFVVISGLAVNEYLIREKWQTLILISILFALGMLSKKSIYPMAIILPFATIFFKKNSLKLLFFIALALALPASIIGSNFEIHKLYPLFIAPLSLIIVVYYIKIGIPQVDENLKKIESAYFLMLISWVIVGLALWNFNKGYFIFSLPFSLFFIYKKTYWGIISFVIQLALIGLFYEEVDYTRIALLISFGFFIYTFSNKKFDGVLFCVSILCFITASVSYGLFVVGLDLVFFTVFFYLLFRKPILGLLFILVINISTAIYWEFDNTQIIIMLFAIVYNINAKYSNAAVSLITSLVILAVFFFSSVINVMDFYMANQVLNLPTEQKGNTIIKTNIKNAPVSKGIFDENRPIGYVENTLIIPHTKIETIGTGFIVLGEYLKLMIFPKDLSFYYGYSKIKTTGLNNLSVWLSILAHLGLIILAIWQLNKRPVITFGIAWYVISILLFSNWPEMVAGMVGERLAFTASAGFSIFIAGVIIWIKPNFSFTKPKGVEFAVFAILIILSVRTFARNADWKDPITLMSHDIKHLENSAQANNLYAIYLMQASVKKQKNPQAKKNYQQLALRHFEKAVSIYPGFFNANFDIGRVSIELKDFNNAKRAFENAFKIEPENLLVIEELAKTSFDLKQHADTELYGNLYLKKDPRNENIHELVAYTMLVTGNKEKAKEYALRGLNYFPANHNLQQILLASSK